MTLACVIALAGCSATKAIEADAQRIKAEAAAVKARTDSSIGHANAIIDTTTEEPNREHAKAIVQDQQFIAKRADAVGQAAQRIDDNAKVGACCIGGGA